jgi:hypothetical protein
VKRVALARGATLVTKSQLRRTPMARALRQRPSGATKPPDWSQEVRDTVRRRSQGQCEVRIVGVCTGQATDLHHRQRRREGQHDATNALHACRRCHGRVHAQVALSHHFGWIVSAWAGPPSVPVFVGGRWVWLTGDGRYEDAEAPL